MNKFWILWVMFAASIFTSCNITEPVVPVSIKITAPDQVDYMTEFNIYLEGSNNVNKIIVKVGGQTYKTLTGSNGTVSVKLDRSVEVTAMAYGEGDQTSQAIKSIAVNMPPVPVITVSGLPEMVRYGDKATFTWNITGVYTKATMGGKEIARTDSLTTGMLLKSEEYFIFVSTPSGSVEKKITINVGDYTTSPFGLLTSGTWTLVKNESILRSDESFMANYPPGEDIYTFKADHTAVNIRNGQTYNRTWELLDNEKTLYCAAKWTIKSVDENTLILYFPTILITDDGFIDIYDKKIFSKSK